MYSFVFIWYLEDQCEIQRYKNEIKQECKTMFRDFATAFHFSHLLYPLAHTNTNSLDTFAKNVLSGSFKLVHQGLRS
jgi:hypothetical protein